MTPKVDLSKFGVPAEKLEGTVISHSMTGRRLLFLFGERHTIRAGIKAHLLNALTLIDEEAISCVGVEGWKDAEAGPVPCDEITKLFNRQKAQHGENEAAIIESVLKDYRSRSFFFWKLLTLLRPALRIDSVEDPALFRQADFIMARTVDHRKENISRFLQQSPLPFSEIPSDEPKEKLIEYKSFTQAVEEFAEHDLNYQRDDVFLKKLRTLWDEAGFDKAAILNAGVSHQYRIARQLRTNPAYRDEFSYVLIEQP